MASLATGKPGSSAKAYDNYDIREPAAVTRPAAPGGTVAAAIAGYRKAQLTDTRTGAIAAMKASMAAARVSLAAQVPTLHVETGRFGVVPEVVDAASATHSLAPAATRPAEQTLRTFLAGHGSLYGLTATETAGLVKFADTANPNGNMSWVGLRQVLNGLPVFQGEMIAGFNPAGALTRTTGNLAAGLDAASLPTAPVLTPAQAVSAGAAAIGRTVRVASLTIMSTESSSHAATLIGGPFSEVTRTEMVYFPVEPGVATLAYSMTLWDQPRAYMVLVDAVDGTLLFRKCITEDQSQAVTYSVYLDDNPSPMSPTGVLPGQGTQAAGITRTTLSLVADDLTASPLGWITDSAAGATVTTTGNNVDAGLDAVSPDGIDGTSGTLTYASRPTSTTRSFVFGYSPAPSGTDAATNYTNSGNNYTLTTEAAGAVTNLFFWSNRYHDRLYNLGFTEAFRNFQTNNFGRNPTGATTNAINGNDAVSAQVHDSSGTDNANFSAPADGSPGRMQMYIFTGPAPSRDGSLDAEIFLHELTHGLSSRLHSNSSGLTTLQARGMGEGWSDFYARCLLSSADEGLAKNYAFGAYATYLFLGSTYNFTDNYYYGIRRFPYAVISAKGGLNNKPFNPLTFADIDPAQIDIGNGAYPPNPIFVASAANEVHNAGEVWCSALLEMRERFITRLGYADTVDANNNKVLGGNNRALQIVTDAMKLDPVNPNMIQGRDSLIAADNAGFGGADVPDIRIAFAARGLGVNATMNGNAVAEDYSPELQIGTVTFTDTLGNNNGFAEPGEDIVINIPLTNVGTVDESANINIGAYSLFVPLTASGGTGTAKINYRVPATTTPGSILPVKVLYRGLYTVNTFDYILRIGLPSTNTIFTETFDGVSAPALPANWTTTTEAATNGKAGTKWTTVTSPVVDAGNNAYAPDLSGNDTAGGGSSLFSPVITFAPNTSDQLTFVHTYTLESGYDGGVLEISIAGGTYTDIVTAGGSFAQGGYTNTIPTGFGNPLAGRNAWSGTATKAGVVVNLPASAAGNGVQFRWRLGFDNGVSAAGWNVDTVKVFQSTYSAAPIDTDGDGLQDGYELAYGLNPNDSTDAAKDNDGDGMTNLLEYIAGTDPNNASSLLRVSQAYLGTDSGILTMNLVVPSTALGKQYVVEYKNDLTDAVWTTSSYGFSGTGRDQTLTIFADNAGKLPGHFYRITAK